MADKLIKHRFHGRRKGKTLTRYRQGLIDNDLPNYVIAAKAAIHGDKDSGLRRSDEIVCNQRETWLEIGFGNGEFLSAMAQQNPDIQFIGCEPFINGIAALLASIKAPLDNLKIWPDDARILMDDIPDHTINRVYLLNPDPWPKTRHEKRRFIQNDNLTQIARILKPNGLFIMSTDVPDLARYMFDKTNAHDAFEWLDKTETDKLNPPDDWPIERTRYMKKALGGEDIYWLRFQRR